MIKKKRYKMGDSCRHIKIITETFAFPVSATSERYLKKEIA